MIVLRGKLLFLILKYKALIRGVGTYRKKKLWTILYSLFTIKSIVYDLGCAYTYKYIVFCRVYLFFCVIVDT